MTNFLKRTLTRRTLNACALAVAAYGFAAWAYVAANALITPWALHLPLTHLARWPRTDTFGAASFAASFVAFLAYALSRPSCSGRRGVDRSPPGP
jgi:hypothetical protein